MKSWDAFIMDMQSGCSTPAGLLSYDVILLLYLFIFIALSFYSYEQDLKKAKQRV